MFFFALWLCALQGAAAFSTGRVMGRARSLLPLSPLSPLSPSAAPAASASALSPSRHRLWADNGTGTTEGECDNGIDRLFKEDLNMLYDSKCSLCMKEVAFLSKRDTAGKL
jgi:hypothetical protein